MAEETNRQILLVKRPVGMPEENCFKILQSEMPSVRNGQILVKSEYISVDPYMRGRMSESKSYSASYSLNEPVKGGVVGRVVETKLDQHKKGDYVSGMLDWADYSVANAEDVRKVNPELAPVSTALGLLGMPGLTAYFGLLDIGSPKEGETVVVSAAAGAVGSVVGQIAKIYGCRTVGIAGSDEKIKFLTEELNYDAAINYKTSAGPQNALGDACPNGVDIYFDNVGGEISDAVLSGINDNARIPICGQISMYNATEIPVGPRVQRILLTHTAMMKGFLVRQYSARYDEALKTMSKWYREGKLKPKESIAEGLENTPSAFIGLFKGNNIGKQLVKVSS